MFGNWCFNCQWCRLNTKWLVAARWRRPGGAASHGGSRAVAYLFSISVVSWALEEVNRKENQNFKKKTLTIEKQKKKKNKKGKEKKRKKKMRNEMENKNSWEHKFIIRGYKLRSKARLNALNTYNICVRCIHNNVSQHFHLLSGTCADCRRACQPPLMIHIQNSQIMWHTINVIFTLIGW